MSLKHLILGVYLALGCAILDADAPVEYHEAKEQWEYMDYQTYSFVLEMQCFLCVPGPVELYVNQSEVVLAFVPGTSNRYMVNLSPTEEVYLLESSYSVPTISELFHNIEQAVKNKDEIEVRFDPLTGAPLYLAVNEAMMPVDAGYRIKISNLKPVTLVTINENGREN